MERGWQRTIGRRRLLGLVGAAGVVAAPGLVAAGGGGGFASVAGLPVWQEGPEAALADLAIDLESEPATLDPATSYDVDSWSVVHSVYDALVQYGPDGSLQPLLAETLTSPDPLTWEVALRPDLRFHNGEPLDAEAVAFSIERIKDPLTKSQVAANFRVIEAVDVVDSLRARLRLSAPAPWLPAQMAAWLAVLPPRYAGDPANDPAIRPIGTGPYRFVGWERGREIRLEVNRDYFPASPKGRPIADVVRFRPVPDPSTRVADLLSGASGLVRAVPVDQVAAVEAGASVVTQPLSGSAWIRIPTDVAPFSDVRVRQALNYAVDVETIVAALLAGNGQRLPNFFVEGGLGWNADLKPYPYNPERARALLAEAGYPDGFDTELAYATTERQQIVAAVAGQLSEVGVRTTIQPVEIATFNATWTDPATAPLRFATWRPMFDPYTLLSLIVSNAGFLSRHDNPTLQPTLEAAAVEPDPAVRAKLYRDLGQGLRDEPAAIYLYRTTAFYGVARTVPAWTARADDYIIPTADASAGAA